jgi:hypothetical protein
MARERINLFTPNLARLCLESRKRFQRGKNSESVLSLSPGEGGFCSSVPKHDRRTDPRTNLFVSARRLPKKRLQTRKMSQVRVPVKVFNLRIIFLTIFNDTYRIIRPMISFREIKIDMKCKHLSDFAAVTLRALCYCTCLTERIIL